MRKSLTMLDPEELLDDDGLEDEEDLGVEDLDTVLAEEDPEAEIVPLIPKRRPRRPRRMSPKMKTRTTKTN